MRRQFVLRGTVTLCMLAGVAALSVRRDGAVRNEPGLFDRWHLLQPGSAAASVSNGAKRNEASAVPHHFSMQYDYCYVDAEGRPMVFHKRRLVFFFPESPPGVEDRTFIETNLCQ